MAWHLEQLDEKFFLERSGQQDEISKIEAGKLGKLEVTLKTCIKVEVALKDFRIDGGSFSREFEGSLSSRTVFLSKWKKCIEKLTERCIETATASGIVDQLLKDKFLGTFDVHIGNLIGPKDGRGSRDVDYSHVSNLEESFREDTGQIVLLVGMLLRNSIPENLKEISEEKLETLGGNHTRLALQSLGEKGLLKKETVKVNVYLPLTKTEALTLGYQHNIVLEERKKQMTFIDKVKIMRECRPRKEMSSAEVTAWKDILCVIFRAENRRKLQVNLAQHLQMARIQDEVFQKVLKYDSQKPVTDKFFKAMLRLDSLEAYHICLDTLLDNGQSAFNAKVSEYIHQGHVRSKKKVVKADSAGCSEDVSQVLQDKDAIKSLQEKVKSLQAEKDELQKELAALRESKKRKREEENIEGEKWKAGDTVDAMWKDKNYYTAEVQKVETIYHVVYLEDKLKGKVAASEIKERT